MRVPIERPLPRSTRDPFRRVLLFAPRAPAVQIFIATMWALDCSQLIIECRWFVIGSRVRSRNHQPARPVLAHPPDVNRTEYHLLWAPDIDVAQRRRRGRFVRCGTLTFGWTFDRHDRFPAYAHHQPPRHTDVDRVPIIRADN